MQNSTTVNIDEFDLSGNREQPRNNVYVVSEENIDFLEQPEDELPAGFEDRTISKSFTRYDPRVINLLSGKRTKVKNESDVQQKLFKLLSINELDQAIVNISYYYDLKNIVPLSAFGSFKIVGLESIGLYYNSRDCTIEGVPEHLGSFQVGIQFNLKGNPFSKLLTINVITLWKETEPPAGSLFPKSNEDSKSVIVDEFKQLGLKNMVAASKRGRSHAYDGKFRDDDFYINYFDKFGWYAAAVCDGAGSARYSREGSRILVEVIGSTLSDFLNDSAFNQTVDGVLATFRVEGDAENLETALKQQVSVIIRSVLVKTIARFRKEAEQLEDATADSFASTCLITLCRKTRYGWLVFSYNVGDGAIGMVDLQHNTAAILCNPDEGKYFGQTRFITTEGITDIEDVRSRIVVKLVKDFDALLLMTDGVSDPKFESDRNLNDSRCWVKFFNTLREQVELFGCNDELEKQLLDYLDFWSIGNHDDRTVVVIF